MLCTTQHCGEAALNRCASAALHLEKSGCESRVEGLQVEGEFIHHWQQQLLCSQSRMQCEAMQAVGGCQQISCTASSSSSAA